MHKKFEINLTKIKGGCQSVRKVVAHNSKSDLPQGKYIFKTFQENENNPTQEQVETFVNENFDPEASEFEEWEPSDWNEDIPFFNKITVIYFCLRVFLNMGFIDWGWSLYLTSARPVLL